MSKKDGWFAIKRGALEHDMFAPKGPWSKFEAWVWMVESAAITDTIIDIGGKPYTVPRGAMCFSQRFMATKFKWSKKAVTTFLAQLQAHKSIVISVAKTGNGTRSKRNQVTLCNYDKYQHGGTKTEPKGDQKGAKEEQLTTIPVGRADKSALSEVVDFSSPQATAWTFGKPMLAKAGVKDPGAMIGKWCRDYCAVELLAALQAADKAQTQDPVPYITATLKGREREPQIGDTRVKANGQRQRYENKFDGWMNEYA